MSHFIEKCKHGTVVRQCRCPGPKAERIVACPFGHEDQTINTSEHCPGCGGWVSTYSGQGEGYECPGNWKAEATERQVTALEAAARELLVALGEVSGTITGRDRLDAAETRLKILLAGDKAEAPRTAREYPPGSGFLTTGTRDPNQ